MFGWLTADLPRTPTRRSAAPRAASPPPGLPPPPNASPTASAFACRNHRQEVGQSVSVRLVGGTNDQLGVYLRFQNASHWPFSLRHSARRWQSASAPSSPQRMPANFSRWPTTVLHALSTAPLPIHQPSARYS